MPVFNLFLSHDKVRKSFEWPVLAPMFFLNGKHVHRLSGIPSKLRKSTLLKMATTFNKRLQTNNFLGKAQLDNLKMAAGKKKKVLQIFTKVRERLKNAQLPGTPLSQRIVEEKGYHS